MSSRSAGAIAGSASLAALLALGTGSAKAQTAPSPSATPAVPSTAPSPEQSAIPSPGGITPNVPAPKPAGAPPGAAPLPGTDESKFKTQLTNTLKFSLGLRTQPSSKRLTNGVNTLNQDDGDRNFAAGGLTSSRADLFSEIDVANKHAGIRVSGEGWYDAAYRGYNANTSPGTINQVTTPYNIFVPQARKISGEDFLLLDAFAFGNFTLGSSHATLRAGRHALQWGQTLFFGNNGIANGMAPIDLTKLLAVPNSQFKELILPVNQLSGELQVNSSLTIGAYYQLEWEKNLFPPVGSYFSAIDAYDEGNQRLFVGGPLFPGGPRAALGGGLEQYPRNNGQEGLEVLWSPAGTGFDFGFYAIQYNEKVLGTDIFNFGAGAGGFPGQIGRFYATFPQGIQSYGASLSTTIGSYNIAAEASYRNNAPLGSDSQVCGALPGLPPGVTLPCGNNSTHPLYAVGRTLHLNGSMLFSVPPTKFAKESSLAFEVAYNDVLKVTQNPAAVDPTSTRSAAAFRFVYTPVYRAVKPGLDLSIPIGMGLGLAGKSTALPPGEMPAGGVGDFEIGLSANYQQKYTFTLGYTGYLGLAGPFLDANNHNSLQQTYSDRNFIAASVSRSF